MENITVSTTQDLNKKARNQRNKQKLQGKNKPVKYQGAQIIKFKK